MKRKLPILAFPIVMVWVLIAVPLASRSPAQQREPTKPKDSIEQDTINADRPGISDGSAVIGAHWFQVEGGIQKEYRRQEGVREHTLFIPILLRIGINNHVEARIEGNTFTWMSNFEPSGMPNNVYGLAPISLGLKYQITESKGIAHPSIGTIARIFPVSGTVDFRTKHVTGDLRLAVDWDFAPQLKLSLNPNVGVGVYEDETEKLFTAALFAVTLNYLPSKKLNLFVDLGSVVPEEKEGKSALIVDGGVAYDVGRNVQLDASLGTRAHGFTPPHPFVSLGISFRTKGFGRGH